MLFRFAAVLLGLLPFVVIELALRTFGLGHSSWHDDPFVGFSAVRPLFELNEAGEIAVRQIHALVPAKET